MPEGVDIPATLEEMDVRAASRKKLTKAERLAATMRAELEKIELGLVTAQSYPWEEYDEVVIVACTQLAAQARSIMGKLVRALALVEPQETKAGPGMTEFIDESLKGTP